VTASPERVAEALRASLKEAERLRLQNRRLVDAASEPVAIVGMSCRYPGASSPDALWQLLTDGECAISAFPSDRGWDLEGVFDAATEGFGISRPPVGGFLEDAAGFDPEFFGISPREALGMDPQQRLLLEASWEALEDAGIDPLSLRGTRSGVFAGAMYHDYGWGLSQAHEAAVYLPSGGTSSIVSGRVAYTLGLEGPAISIDTACSSSLVALHLAAQALRGGECSLALAGGAAIYSTPGVFIQFSRQGVLSADGLCRSFAESADGSGFSEGVGMLVLERLSDAQRNGHPVLATIRGSAVNQDGASNGLTAPNGPSQERVIRQALESARLSPADVDAVDGHGTGTALGDPIEAGALLATYGQGRERPLKLGSVKSNVGHAQAAAGVAGVIKMVLALREGVLPKLLHLDKPSSKVDWSSGSVELLAEAQPWPPGDRRRRAGVSSFGATGTNVHLILEEPPAPSQPGEDGQGGGSCPLRGPVALVLSAKSASALRDQADRLATHLHDRPELDPASVAYSLVTTRPSFEHRAVVLGEGREQWLAGLRALVSGAESPDLTGGVALAAQSPAFLFGGQGSQHPGMALELLEDSPSFARHMDECEEALEPYVDWSLREILGESEGKWLDRLDVVQPALFAVMVSLARLWQEMGVSPSVVAGHSQGEVAAAHIAGGLSLEDAARVIALRAKAMTKLAGRGAMLSVSLSRADGEALLAPFGERLSLAAINGPASLVVSGEPEALAELRAACERDGVRNRAIAVDYAAHSAQIEELRDELLNAFAPISPCSGRIPFHSTLTGELLDTAKLDAEYWYLNLRQRVLFEPVIRSLLEGGTRAFIEISPHPVLAFGVQEAIGSIPAAEGATVLGTLRRGEEGAERFARSLAEAHTAGIGVDWEAGFPEPARRVPLPTYPFQRKRYWLSSAGNRGDAGGAGLSGTGHPLLAAVLEDPAGDGCTLTGRISLADHPWLEDHAVAGTVLLPGTAFLEMALRAAEEAGAETVEELTLQAPMFFPEQGAVQVQVVLGAADERGRREVTVHSRPEGDGGEGREWTCHAEGVLAAEALDPPEPLGPWPPVGAEPVEVEFLYERLAEAGFEYGPAFQGVRAAWRAGDELYVEAELPEEQAEQAAGFALHPALLDIGGHAGVDAALGAAGAVSEGPALPFAWHGVSLHAPGASSLRLCLIAGEQGGGLRAYDRFGAPVVSVESLLLRPVDPAMLRASSARRLPLYRPEWMGVSPDAVAGEEPPLLAILGEEEIEGAEGELYPSLPALLEAIEAGAPAPEILLADERAAGAGSLPAAAHGQAQRVLGLAQSFLAEQALEGCRLCLLTAGAVAARDGEVPGLATAPAWGLLRSAHSEHPERFSLLDTDASESSASALGTAILSGAREPELALREGEALVPRLARATAAGETAAYPVDPGRTVLITGGTSGIGALLARHLAAEHGARHLLLVSRSGRQAEGVADLEAELVELGAEVTVAACDVADRDRLEALLDDIPEEHPLGAVFHSAGVLDDGVLDALDAERLERVMRPKADAAWHLHELTAEADLSAFVMFSSVMGVLGGAAQANYAAANSFLDALAVHRHAAGLPASALAWGGWAQKSQMIDGSGDGAAMMRMAQQMRERLGFLPMAPEQGLELLDASLALAEPQLVPVTFDEAVLRAQASAGTLPAVLRGLVRVPASRERKRGSLAGRLASVPEAEHDAVVLDLVRTHVAAVLGLPGGSEVEPERAFSDLGFDSLAAVELRNRLVAATGLRLAPTIVFDYPSPAALAGHLRGEATGGAEKAVTARAASVSAEPVAIVGMACRYPGHAESPAALWDLLVAGRDAISAFPEDRGWDLERLYDPDPDQPGTCYAREGGFVGGVADFDPGFFGISPREALAMDPQERALLEACWEAIEDGGLDPQDLRGSETGVFAGVMYQDYGVADEGMGMTSSNVSGRVAYTFGLEGPTMAIDTACSSSLVAMHLAAQALRGGECSLALAGGVSVLSTPNVFTFFSRQRGLALDGRCKAFSESADGTGISEGTGVVLLERLSDAERNGHAVLATIRGSAVNQDGASNGFTAPNGPAQERVIRQALANAALAPADIDAVEAHGTGTTLGDPIEAGAVLATYGQERERPLKLGSIKSNIGHSQAAAGVAGVIKMTMALREGVLPKTLHADEPSSKVDWEAGKVELLTEMESWERGDGPRRAGVSSFGASGTNAHLILEEPLAASPAGDGEQDGTAPATDGAAAAPVLLALSAKTEAALAAVAGRLRAHLAEHPEAEAADVAFSLGGVRASMEHRAVVTGAGRDELLRGLGAVEAGEPGAGIALGRTGKSGKLAYLFTGQGAQRTGMGEELYAAYPAYADAFDLVCEHLDPELGAPLREVVFGDGGTDRLDATNWAQPALFANEVALFRLLESLGLVPGLLAGHSIGELAAAHVAGVLSLAGAARLVAARGKLMGDLPAGGAMLAVQASEPEAEEAIGDSRAELSVAAINGPGSVVLSGGERAIAEAEKHWRDAGRKTKRLVVSHAFHSPLIDPMLEPFEAVARDLDYAPPRIPVVSNLSGELLSPEQATDPAYWVAHAREPVRFADVVRTLRQQGVTAFLELGPEAVLSAMAQECVEAEDPGSAAVFVPSLRGGQPEPASLALAAAGVHAHGIGLDQEALFGSPGAKRVPLPTYPFQRKRYWRDPGLSGAAGLGAAGQAPAGHPLLGASIAVADGGRVLLTGRVSRSSHRWLADHALGDTVLVPGTGLVEMALRAGADAGAATLEELTLQVPLVLPERGGVQLQVSVGAPDEEGRREVSIHSRLEGRDEDGTERDPAWTCNAQGILGEEPAGTIEPLGSWPPPGAEPLEVDDLYERLAARGIGYGPAFQAVKAAWRDGERLYAELALPEGQVQEGRRFGLHPALFDATGHVGMDLALAAAENEDGEPGKLALPFAWRGVRIFSPGAASLHMRVDTSGDGGGLHAFDESGDPVLSVDSLALRPVDPGQLKMPRGRLPLHRLSWVEAGSGAGNGSRPGPVAVIGDAASAGAIGAGAYPGLAELQEAAGQDGAQLPEVVVWVVPGGRDGEDGLAARAHRRAAGVLELLQAWLADERLRQSRLCVLTASAVAAGPGESPDLASAAVWGLLRSAQSEFPGHFVLADTDGTPASLQALPAALAASAGLAQVALRNGTAKVPRLARAGASAETDEAPRFDPDSTVLITGGTGGLGAILARHLVATHGVRHLLLASRRGAGAEGADELLDELRALGAEPEVAACDVADRAQLEALLGSIPPGRPLGAVIHSAGAVDDGVLDSLDAGRLDRVLEPKLDAAWHLHELTAELELSHFVLFSSVAGILGTPGQANYAAANSFLDALALYRSAGGLPAVSLAWGAWIQATGMTSGLDEAALGRVRRLGLVAFPSELGLELFDAACALGEPLLAPVALDPSALRAQAAAGTLPEILTGLAGPVRDAGERQSLASRLAGAAEAERERIVLELVRGHVAAVLGHASSSEIDAEAAFMDLGFDSLAAIELRNRLNAATGLRLQPTVVFDYPSATAVARHLLGEVASALERAGGSAAPGGASAEDALAQLATMLPELRADERLRDRVGDGLRALLADLSAPAGDGAGEEDLASMSHEEMFELIDEEFGAS
jgi:acyl transferase domain-containing protein/acyl carrier protein